MEKLLAAIHFLYKVSSDELLYNLHRFYIDSVLKGIYFTHWLFDWLSS